MGLHIRPFALLVLALSASLNAQSRPGTGSRNVPVELSVRVNYGNNEPAPLQTRVQLMNGSGTVITESFSDSRGEARFPAVSPGTYRLRVTGADIEEVRTDQFTIFSGQGAAMQFVTVTKREDPNAPKASTEGFVSAYMLAIPPKAQKIFDQAVKDYKKKKYDEARGHFQAAIDQYSHYAAAHEYLGVMDADNGDLKRAESHFADALLADPKFVPAFYHLAKLRIQDKDFPAAEEDLKKALALDPRSAEGMFLMVYVLMSGNRFDEVIATTERLHTLPHEQFAAAHIAAGSAYAHKNMKKESREQYQLYLKESPTGPSAQLARNALASLAPAQQD